MENNIEAQYLIDSLVEQRNEAYNRVAQLTSLVRKLQDQLKKDSEPKPAADGL